MSEAECGYLEECYDCMKIHCGLTPKGREVLCPFPNDCPASDPPCGERRVR